MRVIYQFSKKGDGKTNEDILGTEKRYAWVLDGATDVFDNNTFNVESEVSWYMNMLQQTLISYCKRTNNRDLCQVISESVGELYDKLSIKYSLDNVPSYVTPTFAVAMIAVFNCSLYYYVLGDCSVAYYHNGAIHIVNDKRIKEHSQSNRSLIKEYMAKHNYESTPVELFRSTRSKANAADGYPIGTISGEGLNQGLTGMINLHHRDRVLVYSDGILDYLRNNPQIISAFFEDDIDQEIKNLYSFLGDDREYYASPRPKKKDDVSIILVEV